MREHAPQQIADLLDLTRDLTRSATLADTPANLFASAFRALDSCIPFAVGVAVMLEDNLDLYVITPVGGETLVSDRLVEKIRRASRDLVPSSFDSADVVVKAECALLPLHQSGGDDLAHAASAAVKIAGRTAGTVLLFRAGEPFGVAEQQVLEIFAANVAMLLDQLRARDKIQSLADSDDLTGIHNKRWLRRQLPQEIERARTYNLPLSLLMFDVDDFKEVNDRFGHTVGDVVLSELCAVVRKTLRPPDLFARFGGDEFAVILPHTDVSGARVVAERILQRVRSLNIRTESDDDIRCSISIGVADFDAPATSANDLLRRADERLYEAKRSGKNRTSG